MQPGPPAPSSPRRTSAWVVFGRVVAAVVVAVVVWGAGMALLRLVGWRLSPVAVTAVFAVLGPAAAALVAGPGPTPRIATAIPLVVVGLICSWLAMSTLFSLDERYERTLDRVELDDAGFRGGHRSRTGNNICVDVCTAITRYASFDGDLASAAAALRRAARASGLNVKATARGEDSARFTITGAGEPLEAFLYDSGTAGHTTLSLTIGREG